MRVYVSDFNTRILGALGVFLEISLICEFYLQYNLLVVDKFYILFPIMAVKTFMFVL